MYKIIKTENQEEVAIVEKPFYIKVSENGCFTTATKETATGVAIDSTAYPLSGHEDIEGEAVFINEVDAGKTFVSIEEMASAINEGVNSI